MRKIFLAFTLAEVLITLSIIGVVAAITVPTLTSNLQKDIVETQLKVAKSLISQSMSMSQGLGAGDITIIANNTQNMKTWFEEFLAPSLKTQKLCYQKAGCWHKQGEVKTLAGGVPSFETKVGKDESTLGWATMTFVTENGIMFNLDGSSAGTTSSLFGVNSTTPTLQFYFDVNGRKKPNRIGKDIYIMVYAPQIGFVPAGKDKTQAEVKQNCEKGNGYWCLSYVNKNGGEIADTVWNRKK